MSKPLVIFGSAEIATMARWYFAEDSDYEVVAFTVDDEYCDKPELEGLPLVPFSTLARDYPAGQVSAHVALSYKKLNQLREEKYRQVKAAGYTLASYVSTKSAVCKTVPIGDNCLILENQTIQRGCVIGNNVMMWSGNHIGHGTRVEDHCYISSHVVISGHCVIGERTFIGVNATFKDFVTVGSDTFIAMTASIVGDIEKGSVVLGAQSTVFPEDDRRARAIKQKYFFGS